MRLFLILAYIFPALISKGYCLICNSCSSNSPNLCTGSLIVCPNSGDVCTSTYTETIITAYKQTSWTLVRGCGSTTECNQPQTLSNQFMTVSKNTACCTTDDCTPTPPTVLSISTVINGLVCPSCFSLSSLTCVPDTFTQCTGNEILCGTYSTTSFQAPAGPNLLTMGCVTGSFCVSPLGVMSSSVIGQIIENITCSNPTGTFGLTSTTPPAVTTTTGSGIFCVSCSSETQTLCSGPLIQCPAGEVCTSTYTETQYYGQTIWTLVRGCGKTAECNQPKTLSNEFMTVSMNTGCCTTSDCTPTEPVVQAISTVKNGLICPACFSLTSYACIPDTTTHCTGNEIECATYSMHNNSVTSGPYIIMVGCTTANLCTAPTGVMSSIVIGNIVENITCFNPTGQFGLSTTTVPTSTVATGSGIFCVSCSSESQTLCSGPLIQCPVGEVCTSTYTETQYYGQTIWTLVRGCGKTAECNQPKTLSNEFMTVSMNTGCCTTSDCTPTEPVVQAISTVRNGLICPACFSLTSYACIPDTTTHCTGNEIECATYSMHNNSVTSGPYIIMVGCTTANLCTAPIGVMSSIVIGNIVENITCFNPTGQFGLSTTTVPTTPAATSSSIFCVSCSSESQSLCSGPLIQCPAGEVCTSTYTETVYYGQIIWTLVRGCGKTTECNQPKTVSNQFMTVSMNTGCCSTSVCTPTEPVVQAISTVKNGLTCPSCFSLTSYACIPDTRTVCTGNEIQCATYSMHNTSVTSGPYIIMLGCATANLCTEPNGVMSSIVIGNIIENITCYNPSGSFNISTTTVPTTSAATSARIFCVSCSSESQTLCSGPLIQCPAGEVCTSTYTETQYYGQTIWTLVRGCGQTTECNQPKTVSNEFMSVSMNTGCCSTTDCIPAEPVVQAISTVKNGLVCPSCFSLTSYACIPDTTTVCTGNEIQCATYSMHNNSVTSGPYIIMVGCATANLCTAPNGVMSSIVIGNIIENITCFNPSGLSTTTPSTSKFLSCINCTSSSQALCTGPSMICPNSNDVCTSIYTATTIIQAKITSWSLVRGCGQPTECYQPRSLSNQVLGLRINTGCCTSNDCTPPEPAVPALSLITNGLVCPSCLSFSSTNCVSTAIIQCTGSETECVTYAMASSSSFSMAGCATKNLCGNYNGVTTTTVTGHTAISITCRNATLSTTTPSTSTATSKFLTCISCTNMASFESTCTGTPVTCTGTNDVCTSTYTESKILGPGLTTWTLVRGCGQLSECNQPKTLSNTFMTVSINTSCCTTDNCTPPPSIEPSISTLANGLVCPSCFSLTSYSCVPDSFTQCTGTETECATYSMTKLSVTPGPYLLMMGCATGNLCVNPIGVMSTIITGQIIENITCYNPTGIGKSLSCISCTGTSQSLCTGPSVTCPSTTDVCISSYTETKILAQGITTWTLVRGCGQPTECNQPKTLSNQFMTVSINTGCCTTNDCTPVEPIQPVISSVTNGLVCPSCFSLTSRVCIPDTTTTCTGNEAVCATYSTTNTSVTSGPYLLMMGCASTNLCGNTNGVMSSTIIGDITVNVTCNTTKNQPLTCISCSNTTLTPCTGSSITCPSTTDVCTTTYTVSTLQVLGITSYVQVRGCGPPSVCNQPKTLSNTYITTNINTGCCTTNYCTPQQPAVTANTAVRNGLVCPSCFSLTSSTCVPDAKTACTGNETRCSTYTLTRVSAPTTPYLIITGCATKNLCTNSVGVASTSITGGVITNVTCQNATVCLANSTTVAPTTTTKSPYISCVSCTSPSQTLCTGTSISCPSLNDVCMSTYTETKLLDYGLTSWTLVRGCGLPSQCNQPKSLSNNNVTVDLNTACCSTDNCNPGEPIVPVNSQVRNGLMCPSCFSLASTTCAQQTEVLCTGNETVCTTYELSSISDPTKPFLEMAGCATPNLCVNYDGNTTFSITGQVVANITCHNATVVNSNVLTCISCSTDSQTSCTGSSITCPTGDVCTSTYTRTNILASGQISWTLVRGCGPLAECNQPVTLSNQFTTVSMNTGCCTTDNCTPAEPAVAAISTVTNGLSCPACFSLTSTVCLSDVITQCTGTENVCASYSMRNTSVTLGPYLLMQGCATENVCVANSGIVSTITNGPFSMNITCLNATIIPKNSLTCISCSAASESLCIGTPITCPTGDVCTSTYTKTNILSSGITSWTLVRGCGPSTECNKPVTLSNQFTTVSMNTGCCTTDNCTPAEPAVAAISTVTNGLSCPACFSLTSTVCLSDVRTQCTGTENVCASYSMRNTSVTSGPYLLMEGCATENVCVANSGIVSTITNGPFSMNITCLNATIIPNHALTCISCSAASESLCIGPSITCPTGDVCTSTYTKNNILSSGITSWTLVRGCGPSTECNKPVTLSNQFTTVSMNTGCCTTDNCTPVEPAVAAISTVTNGLSCPACFSLTSTVCLSDVRTQCTGTENVCASYSMRNASVTSGPYLLMEGCATENVCVTNSGIVSTITNGPFSMNITCLNASITIPTTRLTCISCSANSQALCSGPSITCPSTADVCISTYTQTQILQFGLANWTLTRGCGQLSQCNQPQYLTNDHMTVRINTGCCTTDNCTPPQPTEAVVSTVINGLVCPSCFSLTSTVCLADATTHCTGTENQCVTYSTSSVTDPSKPYLLAEGCATQGICSNFVGIISSTIVGTTVTNISCSNAAIGPIISTITPVITTITTPPTTQTFSLSCISCTSSSQAPCTGPSITCPSTSDVCTSVYTETQIIDLGTTAWTLVRGCGQPSVCNQPRYLSNQQLTVNMNTSCCTTNNCFPGEPLVLSNSQVRNGLICPSCFSLSSSVCVPDTQMLCTGSETECTTYSLSTVSAPSAPSLIGVGCASASFCANVNGVMSSSIIGQTVLNITCTNAP